MAADGSHIDAAGSGDPDAAAVYAAEEEALPDGGRRFRRFADLVAFVDHALSEPFWAEQFPDAPVSAEVVRRSHSATASGAHVTGDGWDAVIWIRDGSWDAVTVVHELAHVATGSFRDPGRWSTDPGHGERFVSALLVLWRHHLGAHAYGALCSALGARGLSRDHHGGRCPGSE